MLDDSPSTSNSAGPIAAAPRPPMLRSSLLRMVFDQLNARGLAYCVLRGIEELGAAHEAYEIDLLVSPGDLDAFRDVAGRLGFEPMAAWGSAPHVFFVHRDSALGAWIKLDVVTDLRYGPHYTLRAGQVDEYLKRRRLADGVYTLDYADEFVHLVLHCVLDKRSIDSRYQMRLRVLQREIESDAGRLAACAAEFDRWLAPALTYVEVTAACHRAGCARIEERYQPLVRQLLRRQSRAAAWRALRSRAARRLRPWQAFGKRRGMIVALLGPDGSGKTSVATTLAKSAPLAMRRIYMGYGRCDGEAGSWVRRGLWRVANETPAAGPVVLRRMRLVLRWSARVALQMSRSAVVRLRRAGGQVVLLDRHVYDLRLASGQQARHQSTTRRAVRWWLAAITPTPDLVIVLDAPAEVLAARKDEWPLEVLAEQRAAYRRLSDELPQAVVIDAGQEFARVSNDAAEEIWQRRVQTRALSAPAAPPALPAIRDTAEVGRAQIRGSSLLLSGRVIALGVALLAQVLLIRYLTPADFGRWMYALSVVMLLKSVAGLGIDRSVTRFVAFYQERGDRARLLGVILLTIGAVLGTGVLLIAVLYALPDQVMRLTQNQPEPLRLLFILIFLVPLEAMDTLLLAVFASFGNARAIFFRRHIVAPGLRLVAVLAAVLSHASVVVLAYGYVIGALLGILIYGRVLWRLCREAGLFTPIVRVVIPAKEVMAFTFPMLVADVALAVMYGAGALALGYFSDMQSVAIFAAAVPLAMLNQTVMRCFALLYTSSTSKLVAKGDLEGINELYWQTAVWLAVLTFPIFALTFSAAGALTQLLYGTQYAAAGPILALLALGEYVNVALGFNGLTLRVLNRSGYLTAISIGSALLTVLLVVWAAPRYGAWGVAAATSASMVLHNVLKQLGLRLATGVTLFDARYAGFYLALAACAAGLMGANWLMPGSPIAVLALTAIASGAVLFFSKRVLKIADVFPEIRRVPFLRVLLA